MAASELPKLYQGVQKGSFGYKMLETMGWKEGLGLGASNQGITEHIKVKKKQDAFGVGAAEQAHKLRDWTTGMVGYDAILSGLKEITRGGDGSSSDSDSDSDSDSQTTGSGSDQEPVTSRGKARKAEGQATAQCPSRKEPTPQAKGKSSKVAKAPTADDSAKKGKKKKKQQLANTAAPPSSSKQSKRGRKGAPPASAGSSSSEESSSSEDESQDGNSSSSSDDDSGDDGGAVKPSKGNLALGKVSRVRAATHVGRYSKRERAKTVRNYSASDLAAILGILSAAPAVQGGEGADAWAAAAGGAVGNIGNKGSRRLHGSSNTTTTSSSSSSSDDGGNSDGSSSDTNSEPDSGGDSHKESSEQRLRPGTPPGSDTTPSRSQQGCGPEVQQASPSTDGHTLSGRQTATGGAGGREGEAAEEGATAAVGGWWRCLFVKAGGSGSSIGMNPASSKAIKAHGFLEDDQTNLYMQAHATATTGKQGLGRSSMPKKVAGARWQGTKTKLGSDDDEDDAAPSPQQQQHDVAVDSIIAAAAAAGRQQYVKNGILIVLPKKKPDRQAEQQEQVQLAKQSSKQKKRKRQDHNDCLPAQQQQQQEQAVVQCEAGSKKRKQQKQVADRQEGIKKVKKGKSKECPAADLPPSSCTGTGTAAAAAAGSTSKPVKWAKLAAKILEGAPKRRMRIQKLHRQVVAAAGYDISAAGVDLEALYQQMVKKLRKAQGLTMCQRYVGLVQN